MRRIFTLFFILLSFFAKAQDGSPDPNFGNHGDGTSTYNVSVADERLKLIILPSGKIVQCFSAVNGGSHDFGLIQYKSDGTVDDSGAFGGTSGMVTTDFGADEYATSMAVQTDGKLVVAGYEVGSSTVIALARYNSDGSLDQSFGTGGKVTTAVGIEADAYAVLVQSDGKIVVAGYSRAATGTYDFTLVRYTSIGALDNSFGTGGKVITDFNNTSDAAYSLLLQPDGKIVAGGYTQNSTTNFALARYNTDGSLDNTFGSGGKVTTVVSTSLSFISDAAYALTSQTIQSVNYIVAAGSSTNSSGNTDFALVRYQMGNGSLDPNFGINGKTTSDFANDQDAAYSVAIQNDNKIIAGGVATIGGYKTFAAVRYLLSGAPDPSFGAGPRPGETYINFFNNNLQSDATAYSLGLQKSEIVFGGTNGNGTSVGLALAGATNSVGPLPVTFTSFTATKQPNNVLLNWETATELDNAYFEVQRSVDGRQFTTLGTVSSKGNSNTPKSYSFTDHLPAQPIGYYRLRMVDLNQKSTYSRILAVRYAGTAIQLQVFPNPVRDQLQVQLTFPAGIVDFQLLDATGRLIRTVGVHSQGGTTVTSLDMGSLGKGIYFIRVNDQTVKVIKE